MSSRSSSLSGLALALGTFWGLVGPVSGQGPTALEYLERSAERYGQSSSFCADFQQELTIPLLGESRRGSGRICQQQPDLFAMRFSEPTGDQVVADGTYLWAYFPSSDPKQVLRERLQGSPGTIDFHREFLEDPGRKYTIQLGGAELVDGRDARRILLRPQTERGYEEAVLWVDAQSSLVLRVRIIEENGSVRTLELSGIELDAEPEAEMFQFIPPPGTQVIER